MRGNFVERLVALRDSFGASEIVGAVEVNQVYAHYQHEHPEFRHPDGGGAFYLRDPLFAKGTTRYMQALADKALTGTHYALIDAMADSMEDLSREVYLNAPWEFGDLRASGHPSVTADGSTVYDRAPAVGRLNDLDLKAKAHLRYLFDPNRYRRV